MTRDAEVIGLIGQRIDDLECRLDEKMMLLGGGQKERMDRMEAEIMRIGQEVTTIKDTDHGRVSRFEGARTLAAGLVVALTWLATIFAPDLRAAFARGPMTPPAVERRP